MSSLPPMQATRYERLQRRLGSGLLAGLRGTWRHRSLGLLALLLGFFLGQNLTSYWYTRIGQRPFVVLALLLLLELVVRLRTRLLAGEPGLGWRLVDNLRIGLLYAVVLEAFKLGS